MEFCKIKEKIFKNLPVVMLCIKISRISRSSSSGAADMAPNTSFSGQTSLEIEYEQKYLVVNSLDYNLNY